MTRWIKTDVDATEVRRVADRFGLDLLASSIVVRRGLNRASSMRFLLESDLRNLHNPFLLHGMVDAVARINGAIGSGERITVFGDRDVDGVTSTALLTETLARMGASVDWRVPEGSDGYGLSEARVVELANAGTDLLIAVDTGISAVLEVRCAAEHNVDVIVVDHHEPPAETPAAIIINPKMPDCEYPFAGLAACGLASKVAWALRFSQSELYNTPVCLLDARPMNDSVTVQATRMLNLLPQATFFDTVVPGVGGDASFRVASRLEEFAQGCSLAAYDAPVVTRSLTRALGGVDVELDDLAPTLASLAPRLGGKSLLQLRERSKFARYSEGEFTEMDVLREVFVLVALASQPEHGPGALQLELPALATVADQMPLVDENRLIVEQGLKQLSATERPGLRELLARNGLFGRTLAPKDISFKLGPIINAAGRMGEAGKAVRLLLAANAEEAAPLAQELIDLNEARRGLSEGAWQRCLPRARESLDRSGGRLAIATDDRMPRGITGMIANRLLDTLGSPAVVVTIDHDEAVGSMRSVAELSAVDFLDRFDSLLSKHGGHDMAAGFSLPAKQLPEFEAELARAAAELDSSAPTAERERAVDAEIPVGYLAPEVWNTADLFAPYGVANPQLVFLSRRVPVASIEIVGKATPGHVKLTLEAGELRWPALFWNAADKVEEIKAGQEIDIVFRLSRSTFQDAETLQLTLLDVTPAAVAD
jgi:single-stranded-DNA-specific exonuclease